jgi:uncharacterized protein YcbK (DUF882 family)
VGTRFATLLRQKKKDETNSMDVMTSGDVNELKNHECEERYIDIVTNWI